MSSRVPLVACAVAVLGLALSARAEPDRAAGVRLQALEVEGCPGLPFPRPRRELWVRGGQAVDADARFWTLDRPAAYTDLESFARYRMGSGVVRVESRLSPTLDSETTRIWIEQPVEPGYLAVYLPDLELPCERTTRYRVEPAGVQAVNLDALARFDTALHEATELLYDQRFEASRQRLRGAMELRPDDPTPHWMMARLVYLELEERAGSLPPDERIRGYQAAAAFAERAIERAPDQPEGYLWQAIAHGRVLTARGTIRTALGGLVGGQGPQWLEQRLQRAVSLPESFHFFGDSTRSDALYALAQFYRLAPDAWYMALVGTRGDIDRSIELLREVGERQPTRLEYQKELAVALLCRGREEDLAEARGVLERALELPVITGIDTIDHGHAEQLLLDPPANVCGYSRDGFVEFAQ